jgi:voltage-gated potassium channel
MNAERWRNDTYDKHIIVCGWNKSAEAMLRELAAAEHDKVVIVTQSDSVPLAVAERYLVVREDFTRDAVLRHIIFREPSWTHPCMIVLAERDGRTVGDVDARTLMTTMLAERIAKEHKGEHDGDPLYTITQMLDEDNARVLQESVPTANEVFVTGDVIGGMIANSAIAAGSSGVLIELFSSAGENQLFSARIGDLPQWKTGGATYRELIAAFAQETAIPIGFARSGLGRLTRVLNPIGNDLLEKPDDLIYYISRRRMF